MIIRKSYNRIMDLPYHLYEAWVASVVAESIIYPYTDQECRSPDPLSC